MKKVEKASSSETVVASEELEIEIKAGEEDLEDPNETIVEEEIEPQVFITFSCRKQKVWAVL